MRAPCATALPGALPLLLVGHLQAATAPTPARRAPPLRTSRTTGAPEASRTSTRSGGSSRLSDDLGYDSLLQLRLLDRLRAEYPRLQDVTVAEVLPKIHSVGDLVDFVMERLDEGGTTR